MIKSSQIVLFGCWNEGRCNSTLSLPQNSLGQVVDAIKRDRDLKQMDFLVVLGDNYYPKKIKDSKSGKKTKIFSNEDFQSGFDCLASIGKPVHLLLGNHDLENTSGFDFLDAPPRDKECSIISEQRLLSKYNTDFDMETRCKLWGNTLLVFINSMFYTKDAEGSVICYLKQYGMQAALFSGIIETEKDIVLDSIEECLSDKPDVKVKNILVCGHHPFISRKNKDDKACVEFNKYGKTLFSEIYFTVNSLQEEFNGFEDASNFGFNNDELINNREQVYFFIVVLMYTIIKEKL